MKMPPNKLVPTLALSDLDQHHFYPRNDWYPLLATDYNLLHFNQPETYRNHMKFPLSPHRKAVFDFIYPTKGHSVRSKGLDSYEFAANDFFFLPDYHP